jgi:hypothetical protein
MDFPIFHLDFFGNRMLIAVIAVLHVLINHALAVGAMPLITLMEWRGYRTGDARWDRLAYRILAVCFIITTSVGALTGVGIWFSASLVNPAAIGSLIHVFFWAWFTEWVVFVTEVALILVYFLTWKGWGARNKRKHIAVGAVLSVSSWLTMSIIVAILGFMMDSGTWPQQPSFLHGVLNPIYLPQLLFRTPFAMVAAGLFAMLLVGFFTERGGAFRSRAVRFTAIWTGVWTPLCAGGAVAYWFAIPDYMRANFPVALATQAFEKWYTDLGWIIAGAAAVIVLAVALAAMTPRRFPRVALVVPFALCILLLGYFERVREFVRKPYVIERYMYANGIRQDDYPMLAEDGILAHATYVSVREVTDDNRLAAGRDVFRIACTRCHTTHGVNGIVAKLTNLYGDPPWDRQAVSAYIANMHNTRPFMPPFPGNDAERDALAAYLLSLPQSASALSGAQSVGVEFAAPKAG